VRVAFKYVVGLALTALLLWWVLRGVEVEALRVSWSQVSIPGLVVGALLMHGHNVFRVWRWRALLQPVRDRVPFWPMFVAVILGYTMTWAIPGRIGELVRPALLSTRENIPLGPCLGSVLLDRLGDGVAIVLLFALGVFLTPLTGDAAGYAAGVRAVAIGLVVFMAAALAVLMVANAHEERVDAWLARRGRVIGWIGRSVLSVARGTEAFRDPVLLAKVAVNSILAWLFIALGTWAAILASGVDIDLPAVFVLQPMLAFGVALPTPGGAGGYHAAMKAGLVYLLGVPVAQAVTASILAHLVVVLPILLLGVVLMWVEKLSMKDLVAAARGVRDLGAELGPPGETQPLEGKS
jgi:uncharacterized protein (TIRG00374 family)